MQVNDIARVTHEANRALQIIQGDPAPSPPWHMAPDWQRESAVDGVRGALLGRTPQEAHQGWMDHKIAAGWVYGPTKSEAAMTHPCLVPYDDLPEDQKVKDHLFLAVVDALRGSLVDG